MTGVWMLRPLDDLKQYIIFSFEAEGDASSDPTTHPKLESLEGAPGPSRHVFQKGRVGRCPARSLFVFVLFSPVGALNEKTMRFT